MKKLILLVAISLLCANGKAQVDTTKLIQTISANGYAYKHLQALYAMLLPTDTLRLKSDWRGIAFKGAAPYYWNGSTWQVLSSGGGSADSTLFATLYRLDTAKNNLRNSIGEKVPLTRTLTINGVAYDLSADRSWTVSGGSTDSSTFLIDTTYDRLAKVLGTDSLILKSIRLRMNGTTVTPTVTDTTLSYDIITSEPGLADSMAVIRGRYDRSFDTIIYVNDSTVVWQRYDGTADTLQFHPGGTPDLTANFINNQDTTDQDADFRISGKGYIGGKKTAYGNIVNDNFSGTGFSSAYSTSVSNMWTDFSADYLQDSVITAAEGARTNYIQLNKWTARNNWSMTIKYVPVNTGSTHYGLGLGLKSQNSFYSSELFMHYVTANVFGDFGRQHLYLNNETWPYTQTTTGSNRITVTAGDTLRATLSYKDGVLTSSFQNLTTSERADTSYVYGTSVAGTKQAPNAGKFTLFFFGGKHKIFEWKISSDEKTGSVLFKGNSITYGYTATNHDSTFADLTMGGNRELYEKSGGPGDRSSEGVQTIWETRQLRPKYMVLALGNNDAQNGVTGSTYSANIRQIIDSAQSVGTTVILLSNFPLSTANTTTYNDTLKAIAGRYGLKYVNVFDSLKGIGSSYDAAYTTDGIHPNTAGHIIVSRILSREAPELLGTGSLYINTPSVAPAVTHPLVWNESTGEIQRTTVSAFSSPYPISFAKNSTRDSSILTLSNGTRYAVLDSLGGGSSSPYPASFSKNAGRDSIILTLSDGTRFAAKDSTGGASGLIVGTTTISSSNSRGILYDSSGVLKNRGDVAIFSTGELGVGYTSAQGYKLSVNGSILGSTVVTTGTGTFINGLFTSGGFSTSHSNSENADLYVRGGTTASTTTQSEIIIGGASTTGNRASFRGSANYTMVANNSYGGVIFGKELQTEASSGTHALYAKLAIRQDSVVNGTASTTHATSLYIQGPPTTNGSFGTSTAMWIESGDVLLSNGILTATNGLKTGDPGSGVGTWKLGTAVTTSGLVLNTTTYVEVSIGGTVYRLAVVDPPQP